MISRLIAVFLCTLALILPHRLRCWLSEVVGWSLQGIYFAYYGLFNFLVKELKSASEEGDGTPDSAGASE